MTIHPHARKTLLLSSSRIEDLLHASNLIKNGGIVALPTETVYGLAANGLNEAAIALVFLAKNRPLKNPLILHVDQQEKARTLFRFENPREATRFHVLARHFWPGPLTIIAKKAPHICALATGGLSTAAVRIPDNQATRSIMASLDFPLVMPSANLSTRPSPTSASHVLFTLDGRIDAVLDDGKCKVGIESTVIRIDSDRPIVLRPGMILKHEIEEVLEEMVDDSSHLIEAQPLSPGQDLLHYSPRMKSIKLLDLESAKVHWQSDDIFLATTSDFLKLKNYRKYRSKNSINFSLSDDVNCYAKDLYQALYQCEHHPEKSLVIVLPTASRDVKWRAIVDRLMRSAGVLCI